MRQTEGLSVQEREERRREVETRFVAAGRWRDVAGEIDKLWPDDQSDGTCQVRNALTEFAVGRLDVLLGGTPEPAGLTDEYVCELVTRIVETSAPFDEEQVSALRAVADRYIERSIAAEVEEEPLEPPPVQRAQIQARQPQSGKLRAPAAPSRRPTEPEHVPQRIPLPRGQAMEALMHARAEQDTRAGQRNMSERSRNSESGSERDLG